MNSYGTLLVTMQRVQISCLYLTSEYKSICVHMSLDKFCDTVWTPLKFPPGCMNGNMIISLLSNYWCWADAEGGLLHCWSSVVFLSHSHSFFLCPGSLLTAYAIGKPKQAQQKLRQMGLCNASVSSTEWYNM